MLNIVDLLKLKGLDTKKRIKLVRHQDAKCDVNEIYKRGYINIYQSYQHKDIFGNCDYIVSFLGLEGTKALFIGVYEVKSSGIVHGNRDLPNDFIWFERISNDLFHYELEEVAGFEDYKDRIIIEWGKNPLAWHQWLKPKEIVEVVPTGYFMEFPGYLDFILDYHDLKKIIENPRSNKVWFTLLSSVSGIYLIVDNNTGNQYVGSAYGKGGIWGRWANYAKTGHGGNKMLEELLQKDPKYCNNFRFTILRTLDKTITKNEVLKYESLYKAKLGSKAFGLNLN